MRKCFRQQKLLIKRVSCERRLVHGPRRLDGLVSVAAVFALRRQGLLDPRPSAAPHLQLVDLEARRGRVVQQPAALEAGAAAATHATLQRLRQEHAELVFGAAHAQPVRQTLTRTATTINIIHSLYVHICTNYTSLD